MNSFAGADGEAEEMRVIWNVAKVSTFSDFAEAVGMSETALKMKCRDLKIRKWPHRQFQQLFALLRSDRIGADDRAFVAEIYATSLEHQFKLLPSVRRRLARLAQAEYKRTHAESRKKASF